MHFLQFALRRVILFMILLSGTFLYGQRIDWKTAPDETYVFEINNEEALKLLTSTQWIEQIEEVLHSPRGSFVKEWTEEPEKGHFIFATIHKNKVNYQYHPVMPFQVFLFKEYGMLTLQVVDKEENIRKDAKIRLNKKRVYYDKPSQTYTINDESDVRMKILSVELDGFRAFFDLEKHLVSSFWNNDNRSQTPEFYSYLITDKNKYKPGETLRFKSYALKGNRRAIKENLGVWISTPNYHYKKITEVTPHRPGSFAGEFQLHDSLNLRLDRAYSIQLREANGRIVSRADFKYEDYELYGNKLDIQLTTDKHYYPSANQLEIRATDANGLFLPDLKADITVLRRNVLNSYASVLVLPDTLLHKQMVLDAYAPTLIDIPAYLFSESNCQYEVRVSATTSDNQPMSRALHATFYRSCYDIVQTRVGDKVRFSFSELGVEKTVKAKFSYMGGKEVKDITLPYEASFNQSLLGYRIDVAEPAYRKEFSIHSIPPGLELKGGINKGALDLSLENPFDLDFSWYLYEGNTLIQKGGRKDFDFKKVRMIDETKTYYVEIFYTIGGREQVYRRTYAVQPGYLQVDLNMPERVYPGQQVSAEVKVSDFAGRPVSGVDLTAFSFNSQLNYHVANLPYWGNYALTREQRVSYSMRKKSSGYSGDLNFSYWNKKANLSSMEYYQFTYPLRSGMYKKVVDTPDSVTQFAPYVMYQGNEEKIYVIEVDDTPIYYSWTEQPGKYSFPIEAGKPHKITLRLHNKGLVIENFNPVPHKKLIFSLDRDSHHEGVVTLFLDTRPGSYEQERYRQTVASFPVPGFGKSSCFRKDSVDYLVYHPSYNVRNYNVLVGPIPQGYASYDGNVTYMHRGGYAYRFEDNIVYCEKEPRAVPPVFSPSYSTSFANLNDFYLSPQQIMQQSVGAESVEYVWRPSYLHLSENGFDLRIHLPDEAERSGVSNLLFRSVSSGELLFPDQYRYSKKRFSRIPSDVYDVIVLYNNGKYLKQDSILLNQHSYVELKMHGLPLNEKDSLSEQWLAYNRYSAEIAEWNNKSMQQNSEHAFRYYRLSPQANSSSVCGYVYDENGEPLIGVSVLVKGTTHGTMTDIDGAFCINTGEYGNVLEFSYIGYEKKIIEVKSSTHLKVVMREEQAMLDEVVVVGYGYSRKSSTTGSVSSVSAESARTVPSEEVEESVDEEESADAAAELLYNELLQLNGLRRNFSDVGFWEPRLYTNRKGKAEFTVTFPDNITKWEAVVYAMNRKLMTGTGRKSILSYKPLMGELKTPQFLTVGDSSYFAGTVRNYTKDSLIYGKVSFVERGDTLMHKDVSFKNSQNDRLFVEALNTDSITAQYLFTRNDGYRDGEERTIPVVPMGTKLSKGSLGFLRNGDTVLFEAAENEELEVRITGKQLDIYMDATYYLMGYEYACNEQLASKLIGLLNYKMYTAYNQKEFVYDKNVNEIIRRLLLNQNSNSLWSWWGRSSATSYWMSAHIMRALNMARKAGYEVALNMSKVENNYVYLLPYRKMQLHDIETLHVLSELGVTEKFLAASDSLMKLVRQYEATEDSVARKSKYYISRSFLKEKLLLWDIQYKQRAESVRDSLLLYLKEDMLGRVYCSDGKRPYSWYANNLTTTLLAYNIVRQDSSLLHFKEPMQMAILASRENGWNTYQASLAVKTILPDLLAESSTKDHIAGIRVKGKENREISEFPYKVILKPGEQLSVEKIDGMPLIYNSYYQKRVTEENITKAFRISTYLNQPTVIEGKPVNMVVELEVKQEGAEYVMLEIPIPAGCSYANKTMPYRETYREYFKEKTMIYCQQLPVGMYYFAIELLPRYTGNYILNPAKVELMYFPVINANNALRSVEITERE